MNTYYGKEMLMKTAVELIQQRITKYEDILNQVWYMMYEDGGKPTEFLVERRAELIAQISVLRQVKSELLEARV